VRGVLQLDFRNYEQVYAKKKARRMIFLDEMEAAIPSDGFHALILRFTPSLLPREIDHRSLLR